MIVLDTNVLFELMKPAPSAAVHEWVSQAGDLHTTAVTLAELFYGIERLPDGERKLAMRTAAAEVMGGFEGRVLPFDARAASVFPILVCERERRGRPLLGSDAQIASICRAHGAALATRNAEDFVHTEVSLIDPWTGARPAS